MRAIRRLGETRDTGDEEGNAVDGEGAHGHRHDLDAGLLEPGWMRQQCARLITNLQHRFDSALTLVDPELAGRCVRCV